jgi:outer membrane protein OmpA-like peptidoglycan-associated protein
MQSVFTQQAQLPEISRKIPLLKLILVLFILSTSAAFSQSPEIQGYWETRINYSCAGGYQNDGYTINLAKVNGAEYSASVYGGTLRIQKKGDRYAFSIEGEKDCIREGTLRYVDYGDTVILKGSWEAKAANRAKLGTGLCCHGDIELVRYTKLPLSEQPVAKASVPAEKAPVAVEKASTPLEKVQQSASAPVLAEKQPEKGDTLQLHHLLFELNSTKLVNEKVGLKELDVLIDQMKKNPNLQVSLEGHTDYGANAIPNIKLSEDRVKVLKDYMIAKGIDAGRIITKGYGGTRPITQNMEERHKNRRVEVIILND